MKKGRTAMTATAMIVVLSLSAQVSVFDSFDPSGGSSHRCISLNGEYAASGFGGVVLYHRVCNEYQTVWSGASTSKEVAVGTSYFAYAQAQFGASGVTVRSLANPGTVVNTINVRVDDFYEAGDQMAFAGNSLSFVRNNSTLEIYAAPNFNSPTTFNGSFSANPSMDADDDDIALLSGGVLSLFSNSGTWSAVGTWNASNVFPSGAFPYDVALDDDRLVWAGYDPSTARCYISVHVKNGSWSSTPDEQFYFNVIAAGDPNNNIVGFHVAMDGDHIFVSDQDDPYQGIVRVFRNDGTTWNNEITPFISASSSSAYPPFGENAMDAEDGYVAITDHPASTLYIYSICQPNGTSCNSDCDASTPEEWVDCVCVPADQCVELEIQYGTANGAVSWTIEGLNFSFSTINGSEASPTSNTTVTYTYDLPTGTGTTPNNYGVSISAPNGGVIGWTMRTCEGRPIIDNSDDWSPSGSTTSTPYRTCGNSAPDFQLPLGSLDITQVQGGILALKYPNCEAGAVTPISLQATNVGSGQIYRYQFFDPDGEMMTDNSETDCNTVWTSCSQERNSLTNDGPTTPNSYNSFKPRRGIWLNVRARINSNSPLPWGSVCSLCFQKPGTSTCPQHAPFWNGEQHAIIDMDYAEIELWPNPSQSGRVNLHIVDLNTTEQIASYALFDATGRQVASGAWMTDGADEYLTEMDLSGQAAGIYLLHVRSGDRLYEQRWMRE